MIPEFFFKLLTSKETSAWMQFIRFSMVGVLNTLVDLLAYIFLTRVLGVFILYPVMSKGLSYISALTFSFFVNGKWTFGEADLDFKKLLTFYASVGTSGLINVSVYYVAVSVFNIYDILAVLLAAVATGVGGFTVAKFIVFKK